MDEATNCDEIPRQFGEVRRDEGMFKTPGWYLAPIECPDTIDSSTPIGRLEVTDTEGL